MDLPPGLSPSGPPMWSPAPSSLSSVSSEKIIPPTVVSLSEENPALQVSDLNFLVPAVSGRHGDLMTSSKNRSICFANTNQVQVFESGVVRTIAKMSGSVVDVSFSPHFDNFVAAVSDSGEAIIHDIKAVRPTFKVVPSREEGPKPFLKVCWHPATATVLATAYQDGLICVWDLFVATQNPKSIVDVVTTMERPTELGIVYSDTPTLLVTMRVPEPLKDVAIVGDFVLTVGASGTIRIYNQKTGDFLAKIEHVEASNIVVVSEAPFVFVAACGPLNQDIKVFRLATASPLQFELSEVFQFAQFPFGHPASQTPFRLMRLSSKGMIVLSHPLLCALWVIAIGSGQVMTYGSHMPFDSLSTHDPSQGFVAISNSSASLVQFSDKTTELVPLLSESLRRTLPSVPKPSVAAHHATSGVESGHARAKVEYVPHVTLDALRLILEKQNEVYLAGLSENRALTLKKQAHMLRSLTELPAAIMAAVAPVLEKLEQVQEKSVDVSNISTAVADAVREPAATVMASYFKEALVPGYQRACKYMAQEVGEVLESAATTYVAQVAPIHTAKVIDPLVAGLAQASAKVTAVYKDIQSSRDKIVASSVSSSQAQTSSSPSSSTSSSSTTTTTTSSSSSTSSTSVPAAPATTTTITTPSTASSSSSSASTSNGTPVTTPAKKKKQQQTSISSPTMTATSALSASAGSALSAATATSSASSTSSSSSQTSPKKAQQQPDSPAKTSSSTAETVVASSSSSPPPASTLPPRPEPKQTVPVNEPTRNAIMSHVSQKQWSEAVNVALASGTVEALGFLTSRADMTQWADNISQAQLQHLLVLILAQTPWPSPTQLQKYSRTVQLILSKLDPSQLSSASSSSSQSQINAEVLEQARIWTTGTSIEASSHPILTTLQAHLP